MIKIEYAVDDISEANRFVASLNRKIVRQRFQSKYKWAPDHIVVLFKDSVAVAMADCLTSPDRKAAHGSLLARPGFGGYAIKALLHLKRHTNIEFWESTLRVPTPATIAISRRYFNVTYDQGAWEISQELIKHHGGHPQFQPLPLFASSALLKTFGIPPLSRIDAASKSQIIVASRNRMNLALRSPSGHVMDNGACGALAFDLLNLPMHTRQHTTRTLLLGAASLYGHPINEEVGRKLVDTSQMGSFFEALANAQIIPDHSRGMFTLVPINENGYEASTRRGSEPE